ncbi:MAG TPA: rhodanese-like domain-containing protein [Candidatus Latescibacteria bacterium]|nr:rhodanese [Gemmatimonadota bacterium]HCR18148.1 rhodanese-like domain-containing protein [Candidatus Latescibacterota bacterium]
MPIEQINPNEAKAGLDDDPEAVYLDVRTEMEFAQGHAVGAINIPVAFQDPAIGMTHNTEFQAVAEKNLDKDRTIYCGCQVGARSQMAAEILERAGFTKLKNIQGGFGGKRDQQTGQVLMEGWRELGLPVSTDVNEENSYEGLKYKGKP